MISHNVYHVTVVNVSISAAQDLFEIAPADDKPVELVSVLVTWRDSEANEQLTVTIQRRSGAFTSGSGGTTPTANPRVIGDRAAGFTVEANNTTRATGGTVEVLHVEGFPSQGGAAMVPLPGMEWAAKQAEALIVGLENAPAGATGFNLTAVIREVI
jgi:hypothetical protein